MKSLSESGKRLEPAEEGTLNFYAADYDCNGMITAADARSILRLAVGLEP